MQRVNFDKAWMAVRAFEEDITLCTHEGEDRYTRITTAPDVLRYLYRLYVPIEQLPSVEAICKAN